MITDENKAKIKELIGRGQATLLYTYPQGYAGFLELSGYLWEGGMRIPCAYLGPRVEKDGGYGPIEEHMFKDGKLVIVDVSLKDKCYLEVLKTLSRLRAVGNQDIFYVTEVPPEVISSADLLLRAYQRDNRLDLSFFAKPVRIFAEANKVEVGSASKGRKPRIIGKTASREYGIGLALAIDGIRRDLYTEDSGSSEGTGEMPSFFVDVDDGGNPKIKGNDMRKRLLIISESGKRLDGARRVLEPRYAVTVNKDPKDGMRGLLEGRYAADAVLLDDHMRGGSNGSNIIRAAKGVPVFLVTKSKPDTDFLHKALGDGARGSILRPLTPEKVEEALGKVFLD